MVVNRYCTAHATVARVPFISDLILPAMPPASAVANKQCDTGPGFYGEDVEVLTIDLFDGAYERGEKRGSCVSLTSPPLPLSP